MAQNDAVTKFVTIANGAALSSVLTLPQSFYLAGITKDDTMDTSVAITFKVSMDNITYFALYDTAGVEISYTVQDNAAEAITIPPTVFYPWEYIKIAVADNQTGVTTIGCVVKQY